MFGTQLRELRESVRKANQEDGELDLRYQVLPRLIVGRLCDNLQEAKNVAKLWLHGCHLDDIGFLHLVSHLPGSGVEHISASDNLITNAGIAAAAQWVKANSGTKAMIPQLKYLSLRENKLSGEEVVLDELTLQSSFDNYANIDSAETSVGDSPPQRDRMEAQQDSDNNDNGHHDGDDDDHDDATDDETRDSSPPLPTHATTTSTAESSLLSAAQYHAHTQTLSHTSIPGHRQGTQQAADDQQHPHDDARAVQHGHGVTSLGDSIVVLCRAMPIEELSVEDNPVGDGFVKTLFDVLQPSSTSDTLPLKILSLHNCGLTDRSLAAIGTALQHNNTLTELCLGGNNFSPMACAAFIKDTLSADTYRGSMRFITLPKHLKECLADIVGHTNVKFGWID